MEWLPKQMASSSCFIIAKLNHSMASFLSTGIVLAQVAHISDMITSYVLHCAKIRSRLHAWALRLFFCRHQASTGEPYKNYMPLSPNWTPANTWHTTCFFLSPNWISISQGAPFLFLVILSLTKISHDSTVENSTILKWLNFHNCWLG